MFSNKFHVTELSSCAVISALLESLSDRLVTRKDEKGAAFDHMSEVFDGLIHCQELEVVRGVLLLSGTELMGVGRQGLPSSQTRRCNAAPIAISEGSVSKTNLAVGSGLARSLARDRLALQSLIVWTMLDVQSTVCDPLNLGQANA